MRGWSGGLGPPDNATGRYETPLTVAMGRGPRVRQRGRPRRARTPTAFIAVATSQRQAQQPLALEFLTERREELREGDL